MRLKFINIGIIKEANILIDGLTVLAGVNDTGKSTVGRLLYSLIKVSNNYKQVLKVNQSQQLQVIVNKLADEAKEYFYQTYDRKDPILREELSHINMVSEGFLETLLEDSLIFNDYEWIINLVKEFAKRISFHAKDTELNHYAIQIKKVIELDENSPEVKKAAFDLMIREEFINQISFVNSNLPSRIEFTDNGNTLIDIEIVDDATTGIKNLKSTFISDITYIESPLQLRENGWKDKTGNGRVYLKSHVNDLADKLSESDSGTENIIQEIERSEKINKFEKIITDIIGGDINYKAGKRNFIFSKNGNEIRLTNTATGIRVFAMLKLLLGSGNLRKNSILIIDEPEVHLHPQWQMDYAELIVRMVNELGIKVLINSHSPYMIEAFKVYSEHYGISEATNFYSMIKSKDFTKVKLVNDSLGKIFTELSDPFKKLDSIEVGDIDK